MTLPSADVPPALPAAADRALLARRAAHAAWHLHYGHRVVWYALVGPGLVLFVGMLLLRGTAEDPVRNLAASRAAMLALAPPKVSPELNAATDYAAAHAAKVAYVSPKSGRSGGYQEDHPELFLSRDSHYLDEPAVKQFYAANENAVQLLRAGAAKERCNWGLNYAAGFGMMLGHLSQMRSSARLLAGHARAHAHAGDHQTAAQDISAIYAMARHLEADPVLINGLVSVALCALADSALEAIIAFDTPSKPEDVQAYRAAVWLDRKPHECWVRYMVGEKAFGLYTIDGLFANPGAFSAAAGSGLFGSGGPPFLAGGAILYGGERRCYAAVMDEVIARILKGETFGEAELMAAIDRQQEGTSMFAHLLIPVLGRSHISFCRGAEKARTVDAGLALLAYRLKHGRDPKTLDELVPEFLAAVPRGVFHDQPLRLRVDPEGVIEYEPRTSKKFRRGTSKEFRRDRGVLRIYTVGEKGVDDGGLNTTDDDYYSRCFCVPPVVRTPREEWKKK